VHWDNQLCQNWTVWFSFGKAKVGSKRLSRLAQEDLGGQSKGQISALESPPAFHEGGFVRHASVIKGRSAYHAKADFAPNGGHLTDNFVVCGLPPGGAGRHEIDQFGGAVLGEKTRH
jgi:hypothetical protein